MKRHIIASPKRRQKLALQLRIEDVMREMTRSASGAEFATLLGELQEAKTDLDRVMALDDEPTCALCRARVYLNNARAGSVHFARMGRHDGSDALIATDRTAAEVKLCESCYDLFHSGVSGCAVDPEEATSRVAKRKKELAPNPPTS